VWEAVQQRSSRSLADLEKLGTHRFVLPEGPERFVPETVLAPLTPVRIASRCLFFA